MAGMTPVQHGGDSWSHDFCLFLAQALELTSSTDAQRAEHAHAYTHANFHLHELASFEEQGVSLHVAAAREAARAVVNASALSAWKRLYLGWHDFVTSKVVAERVIGQLAVAIRGPWPFAWLKLDSHARLLVQSRRDVAEAKQSGSVSKRLTAEKLEL
eukprot:4912694-Pleurochrysis_carterae.AAC.4